MPPPQSGHVRRYCRLCAAQDRATCRPGLCPAASHPRAGVSPLGHVVRLLPEPIPAVARHCSVCRATSCLPTFHASCPNCAAAFPALSWLTRVPPRHGALARAPPHRHARRRCASSCHRSVTFCSQTRACPGVSNTLNRALHTHFLLLFLCSDRHLPPDLCRASGPPSTGAHTPPEPQSSVALAPP
jgi:hypothetical protein